ncbi:hypothetical protein MHB40_12685 [Lysinibacillus sp. FSL K6-0057]|jgi:hypothetical protein|uniref:hypothetical protein n=1 Tax=Lysinibacillus sp. FSL K6-0057 TaxID=2921411 RepID=UPI00315A549E
MRAFIILLQIVRWLFILVICCAGIILGAVILGMMGIDVPNIEPILNIASVPILLFSNKIFLIIINIFVIFVLLYFQLRTLKKANKE